MLGRLNEEIGILQQSQVQSKNGGPSGQYLSQMEVQPVSHEGFTFNHSFEQKYPTLLKTKALVSLLKLKPTNQNEFIVQQIRKGVLPFLEKKETETENLKACVNALSELSNIEWYDNHVLNVHVNHAKAFEPTLPELTERK